MVSVNCQVPLVVVVVFVKIGCQLSGTARFVLAQMRVVAFGRPTKFNVTLPLVPLKMLVTSGVTTVREATLLVTLPNALVMSTEYRPADCGAILGRVSVAKADGENTGVFVLKHHW